LSSLAPAPLVSAPSGADEAARWHDFPGLVNADGARWHYLDTAATAQKPRQVIDAVIRAIGADYATVHRGVYSRSAQMTLGYEAARRRVAAFVGGAEDEIVFTRGATEAINLVAYAYPDKGRVLLSRGASANTKPELEIFADDVKCAHGAAIGRLDETAAFYMAARGLPPETARKLLVRAFVADAFAAHGEPDALLDAALGVLGDAG
jgi:hypothetical protein